MQVSQLMPRPCILHRSSLNDFVCLFINEKGVVRVNAPDIIVFLLTSDNEDLVLRLD